MQVLEPTFEVTTDWRTAADERLARKFGVTVAELRAVEAEVADATHSSSLHDLVVIPTAKASPIEQLATALGWNRKKLYRNLAQIPGVEKLDPSKPKSHFHVPDPIDSARRYNAGERRRVA